jgi:hypothetical protein
MVPRENACSAGGVRCVTEIGGGWVCVAWCALHLCVVTCVLHLWRGWLALCDTCVTLVVRVMCFAPQDAKAKREASAGVSRLLGFAKSKTEVRDC